MKQNWHYSWKMSVQGFPDLCSSNIPDCCFCIRVLHSVCFPQERSGLPYQLLQDSLWIVKVREDFHLLENMFNLFFRASGVSCFCYSEMCDFCDMIWHFSNSDTKTEDMKVYWSAIVNQATKEKCSNSCRIHDMKKGSIVRLEGFFYDWQTAKTTIDKNNTEFAVEGTDRMVDLRACTQRVNLSFTSSKGMHGCTALEGIWFGDLPNIYLTTFNEDDFVDEFQTGDILALLILRSQDGIPGPSIPFQNLFFWNICLRRQSMLLWVVDWQ